MNNDSEIWNVVEIAVPYPKSNRHWICVNLSVSWCDCKGKGESGKRCAMSLMQHCCAVEEENNIQEG